MVAPDLVLGPLLRYVGASDATVRVEADAACEVEVLGRRSRTFHIEGHHYALLHVPELEPGTSYEYEVLRGHRSMVDADEWAWILEHATGDFDHLLLGTSLLDLLGPGMHYLQASNEAVCSARGEGGRRGGGRGSCAPRTWTTGARSTNRSPNSPDSSGP